MSQRSNTKPREQQECQQHNNQQNKKEETKIDLTNAHASGVVVFGLNGELPIDMIRVIYIEAWCAQRPGSFI
jgi:hypothetical protein